MTFHEFKEKYQKKPVEEVSASPPANPVISVLVQTYQQKDFIRECLDSILVQETDFDFEILIGDDGSTDGTREICLDYAEKYPEKIRLFLHHRENQIKVMGEPTSNFNAFYNFFSAKGNYIAFCEGDDIWIDPLKLQKEVDFLESNSEFVLTYHEFRAIDKYSKNSQSKIELIQPKTDIISEDLQKVIYHPLLLCCCFRNVITGIPSEILQIINMDTFLFSILGQYGNAKFLKNITASHYRTHEGGIWSKKKRQKKLFSKLLTYEKLIAFYSQKRNKAIKDFFEIQRSKSFKMLLLNLLKSGNLYQVFKTTREFYFNKA